MLYLARPDAPQLSQIHVIAQHCGLPEPFLGQILRLLVRAGIVNSKKGVGGGFSLARPASEITFLQVLEGLEGPISLTICQSPTDTCNVAGRCSMEMVWTRAQKALVDVLRETTLDSAHCPGHFPDISVELIAQETPTIPPTSSS